MKNPHSRRGFTLIEILVVISIISVLSSIVLASISQVQAKGRDSRRTQNLVQFRNALELYASNHNGQYPPVSINTSGIALTSRGTVTVPGGGQPSCGAGSNWNSNDINGSGQAFMDNMLLYLAKLPTDPVNDQSHCYIYRGTLSQTPSPAGTGVDTAVLYANQLESGSNANQSTGIVTGSDTANYYTSAGVPPLGTVIGSGTVNPPPTGPMCAGTPNCAQFSAAISVPTPDLSICNQAFNTQTNVLCVASLTNNYVNGVQQNICMPAAGTCGSVPQNVCQELTTNPRSSGSGCQWQP